jgi:hypothetical protein
MSYDLSRITRRFRTNEGELPAARPSDSHGAVVQGISGSEPGHAGAGPSNKGMKLTKLVAAPDRAYKVPPRARAAGMDAGTASQLIPGVLRTCWGSAG